MTDKAEELLSRNPGLKSAPAAKKFANGEPQ
jgi:hypothetical protein